MYDNSWHGIGWRKNFLRQQGVSEDVIATLDLEDDGDHDTLMIKIKKDQEDEEGGLCIELFEEEGDDMTLNVLDTMLGAISAHRKSHFTKLGLRGPLLLAQVDLVPENFTTALGPLLDVLAKYFNNSTDLSIHPIENNFQSPDDFETWLNFVLALVERFRDAHDDDSDHQVSKLTLETIAGPDEGHRFFFQRLPTLLPHVKTLELFKIDAGSPYGTHANPNVLAGFIGRFPNLHTLVMAAANYSDDDYEMDGMIANFDPIKLAIQAHPKLKSFTWHTSPDHVISDKSVTPEALIRGFPNLESISFGEFRTTNPEGTAAGIVAAVSAHDNLQSFRFPGCLVPRQPRAEHWTKVPLDGASQDAILHKLAFNRAKVLLGDNPTFQQWVVAMVAFRHELAIVDWLLQKGLGDGPSDWVPHAMDGFARRHGATVESLAQYKRAQDEEEELGRKRAAFQRSQFE